MSMPVAVLAGGLATRLGAAAADTPKLLVDVAGRPFAVHQIELLRRAGYDDIVYLVGHLADRIEAALGDGRAFGVRIRYVADGPVRLGTGGAVRAAAPLLGARFFVIYGDSYLDCDYPAVEQTFVRSGRQGLMTVFRNDGQWDASNVHYENGRIAVYDKAARTPSMRHIDYGLNAFRAEAFDPYAAGTAFDLSDVQRDLLARSELASFEVDSRFFEIGSPAGLEETRRHLATTLRLRSGQA